MHLSTKDFLYWQELLFNDEYPGYFKPGSERTDSYTVGQYEYAHLAPKYMHNWCDKGLYCFSRKSSNAFALLNSLRQVASERAISMGIGPDFLPRLEDGTLRFLRYPPGACIDKHTDFNLFTMPLWRSSWENYQVDAPHGKGELHVGEILAMLQPGCDATVHYTTASEVWQYSVVYFAMPSLASVLPNGMTVADWLVERKKAARTRDHKDN